MFSWACLGKWLRPQRGHGEYDPSKYRLDKYKLLWYIIHGILIVDKIVLEESMNLKFVNLPFSYDNIITIHYFKLFLKYYQNS